MRKFTYGLTLQDFMNRCRQVGLPYSRNAVINWEKAGYVTYQRTPGGHRKFDSLAEIDTKIKEVVDKMGADIKAPKILEEDIEFGVK